MNKFARAVFRSLLLLCKNAPKIWRYAKKGNKNNEKMRNRFLLMCGVRSTSFKKFYRVAGFKKNHLSVKKVFQI
jgi:hypothetical protein